MSSKIINEAPSRLSKMSPLLAVALIPAVISWYTTSEGMAQIFPNLPVISRIVSAIIILVFAFMSNQVGVALANYQTQQHFAQTTGRAMAVGIVLRGVLFSLLFFFALFFSFKFYYTALYNAGQRQIDAQALPSRMQAAALEPVRARVADIGRSTGDSSVVKDWFDHVSSIAAEAREDRQLLESAFLKRSADLAAQNSRLNEIDLRLTSDIAERDTLQRQETGLRTSLAGPRKALADAQTRMAKERMGAFGAKKGTGPLYKKALSDATRAQGDIDFIDSQIKAIDQQLFGSDGQGGLIKQIADLNVEKGNIGLNSGTDSGQLVDSFVAAVQQFRDVPSAAQYGVVSDLCGKLTAVAASAIPGRIDAANCVSPAALAMLGSAKPRLAAFQTFQTNCSASALDARNKAAATREGIDTFEAARQAVNDCLTNAEDAGLDVSGARSSFDAFITIYSPNRDPTTRAIDGLLFRAGQVQAGMAYAFAIAQELLILALSFFAEWRRPKDSRTLYRPDIAILPEDSPQVAAAKLVLASRRPVKGVSRLFRVDGSFPDQPDLDPALKTNAQNHLMHLVEDEVARAGDLDSEFFLGPDALRRLESIVLETSAAHPARVVEPRLVTYEVPPAQPSERTSRNEEGRPPPAEASIRRRRRR